MDRSGRGFNPRPAQIGSRPDRLIRNRPLYSQSFPRAKPEAHARAQVKGFNKGRMLQIAIPRALKQSPAWKNPRRTQDAKCPALVQTRANRTAGQHPNRPPKSPAQRRMRQTRKISRSRNAIRTRQTMRPRRTRARTIVLPHINVRTASHWARVKSGAATQSGHAPMCEFTVLQNFDCGIGKATVAVFARDSRFPFGAFGLRLRVVRGECESASEHHRRANSPTNFKG